MKAMVLGGAGFVGSHLVDRLLAEGHAVDVVDDLSTGSLAHLADARAQGSDSGFKFHNMDVATPAFRELVALRRPEVVFHLTALAPGRAAVECGPAAVSGMVSVLEAARSHRVDKVVVALPAVDLYGDVATKDLPVKEGYDRTPVGVRGVMARAVAELLGVYRSQHAVEFTALALASVYGPRQRPDGGVIAAFASALADGEAPVIHGDGRQTRDFVFVDDTVDAFVRAASRGSGLVVNVGTGVQTPVRDLWTLMAGDRGAPPVHGPRRDADPVRFAVSPVRARIHLAWSPWTDLAHGLRSLR